MTTIRISTTGGRVVYEATGHAGEPHVCSAVSMMSGAVAAWAIKHGRNTEHSETSGKVKVSFDSTYDALMAILLVKDGLAALEQNYGEYVKLISG